MSETNSRSAIRYRGLTAAEVENSRRLHGENLLAPPEREPWYKQFLAKFDDPVIRILIIAALISAATGGLVEGAGIVIAVLLATRLVLPERIPRRKGVRHSEQGQRRYAGQGDPRR